MSAATLSSSLVGTDQDQPSAMLDFDYKKNKGEEAHRKNTVRQLAYIRHNDFVPPKNGYNERTKTLEELQKLNDNVDWIHLYRDQAAVFESLEIMHGCQNHLLESVTPCSAIIVVTVVTCHATKRGTRAVVGLVRGGHAPQIIARGNGFHLFPIWPNLLPYILHGTPAQYSCKHSAVPQHHQASSPAIFIGPGMNEGESQIRWLKRTSMIGEALAAATKAAAEYAIVCGVPPPPITMVAAGSLSSMVWPMHREHPPNLLNFVVPLRVSIGMWGLAMPTIEQSFSGFFKETTNVKPLSRSAPDGNSIINLFWGNNNDYITTIIISPRSKVWKLNNGVKCKYELTRGKICAVDKDGQITGRQTLDSTTPFTHSQKLADIDNFLKKTL